MPDNNFPFFATFFVNLVLVLLFISVPMFIAFWIFKGAKSNSETVRLQQETKQLLSELVEQQKETNRLLSRLSNLKPE